MSTTALDVGGARSASSSAFLVGLLGVAIVLTYVDRGLLAPPAGTGPLNGNTFVGWYDPLGRYIFAGFTMNLDPS